MKTKKNLSNPREVEMSNKFMRGIPVLFASLMVTSGVNAADTPATADMKPNGCKGVSLCHTYPDIDSNCFHLDVGFLLEQFRLTGVDVAYTTDNYGGATNVSQMVYPMWKVKWGITAGLGYKMAHDDWAVMARFDWLSGNGNTSTSGPTGAVDIWQQDGIWSIGTSSQSSDSMSINFYNFDFSLNKGTYFTGCFCVEPHFGVKANWIQFRDTATYGTPTTRRVNTKFWGVGPEFGVDSGWHLAEGFSFFFNGTTALLLGYNSMNTHYVNGLTSANVSGSNQVFSPAIRAIIGLKYDKDVYCNRQHIALRAGWDTSVFFNQWNHLVASDEVNPIYHTSVNNTFGMTGLLVDLGWDF